jgi:hypothetical protein
MTQAARQTRRAWPVIGLIGAYVISRAAFYIAGAHFDLRPLDTSWQILDPVLLYHNLLQSLFFMPGQPPLYNLMLGGVFKAGGHDTALLREIFRGLYSVMALLAVLLLYALMRRLAVNRGLAFVVALIFLLTPALVLYELMPYYTVPALALLAAIAWLFNACLRAFTWARALALFVAMTVLIYVRSMFQMEWFIVLVAFCVLVLPGHRRQVLTAAAVPLLIIIALYAKNAAITGHFATSDWLGMSLSKLTTDQLPHAERRRLIAAGKLSPIAGKPPFGAPDVYPRIFARTASTGIPVLDKARKSTGHINFNALAYAKVSEQALADDLATIKIHPKVYLNAVGMAWLEFWRPSGDYPFVADNRNAIDSYSRAFSAVLAGQPAYPKSPGFDLHLDQVGILIAIGYLLTVGFGVFIIVRCIGRRRVSACEATLIFLWLNIMYVSVIGNALEVDENQRFRFLVNPFIATLLAVCGQRIGLVLRRGKQKSQAKTVSRSPVSKAST